MAFKVSMTSDDLRREIESQMGRSLPGRMWNFFLRKGYVQDVLKAHDHGEVVAEIRARNLLTQDAFELLGDHRPAVEMLPAKQATRASERRQLVSVLLVQQANNVPAVRAFRESVLKDRLLKFDQVQKWLESQGKRDGKPSLYMGDVPLPDGSKEEHKPRHGGFSFRLPSRVIWSSQLRRHLLKYGVPEDRWLRALLVRHGGALDRLRQLSEQLSQDFQWQPGQATIFVLTGMIPVLHEITWNANTRGRGLITLTVDPAVRPRDVAGAYREAQRQVVGRRSRTLSLKHLKLAAFTDPQIRAEPWAKIMDRWNRTYPKYRYQRESLFSRDVLQARTRVLSRKVMTEKILESMVAGSQTKKSKERRQNG